MLPTHHRRSGRDDVARPGPRDVAAAVVVTALALVAPVTGGQGPASEGGWWGALGLVAALGQGVPLAWRYTRPRVCGAVVLASYAASAMLAGLTVPLGPWTVVWSTGSAPEGSPARGPDRLRGSTALLTWGGAGLTCLLILVAELAHPGAGASGLLLVVTALVVTATRTVRADRARVAAVRAKGAADERLRLARELHDVVGHGLGVVGIQSSTARIALQRGDTDTASRAIGLVEAASRTAMREMRQMLGVLTDEPGGEQSASLPGIADIGELVRGARETGMVVDWNDAGPWDAVPSAVQLCAFRVVQEGLTNVMKHAPGGHVLVEVGVGEATLVATVTSTGPMTDVVEPTTGLGLAGLRARVDALGGRFAAGPQGPAASGHPRGRSIAAAMTTGGSATGWRIEAVLPLKADPR